MVVAVLGAGAIGGVVAARLHQAGHEVALIARGAQLTALRERGVRVESPAGVQTVPVPVVGEPREIAWGPRDIVLLAVKSQHTQAALGGLRAAAPAETPVVCLQNGIANEPAALRLFPHVYGVSVACPTSYLSPGVVQAWSATVTGLLDVGRYPAGIDRTSEEVAAAFASAGFDARAVGDVRRWKHRKLLTNLGNAVEAVCGPPARHGALDELLLEEGEAVLAAAGLPCATPEEDRARRGDLLRLGQIDGRSRPGGSSWQSLHRHTGDIETDYLNGEIVLLGRMAGVAAPANELVRRLAYECAAGVQSPCSVPEADVLEALRAPSGDDPAEPLRRRLTAPPT